MCCFSGDLHCANLEITGTPGQPGATRCKVYLDRTRFMPILMVNDDGVVCSIAMCTYDNKELEDQVIFSQGIGKGCSLTVVEPKPQA